MDIAFRENENLGHMRQPYKNTSFVIIEWKKTAKRNKRIISGFTIILGPALIQAWTRAGKPPPTTSQPNFEFTRRMIGVTLSF